MASTLGIASTALGDARRDALRRTATALTLSGGYGLALGLRHGGAAVLWSTAGVPAGVLAGVLFSIPSLWVLLLHFGVEIDSQSLVDALLESTALVGKVLGGLAPTVALVVLSAESDLAASVCAWAGLLLAGALGARGLHRRLSSSAAVRVVTLRFAAEACFIAFAALASVRTWLTAIPLLGSG